MPDILLCTPRKNIKTEWKESIGKDFNTKSAPNLYTIVGDLDLLSSYILLYDYSSFAGNFVNDMFILKEFENIATIAMSKEPTFAEGSELLKHGVKGYANIHLSRPNLLQAIDVASSGNIWLYPAFVHSMIKEFSTKEVQDPVKKDYMTQKLSSREKEIAYLAAEGLSNKEISRDLDIAERTAKAHMTQIYKKLNISDRLSLALLLTHLTH